ncbi:MAG: hypothetical protein H7249_10030 [Chitinophagaceae bacterium]|nr:hypothetical protein [Oligoflexus sp.]
MPAFALADAAHAVGANCIIVGLPTTRVMSEKRLEAYRGELRLKMPEVADLWVGLQRMKCSWIPGSTSLKI